MILNLKQVRFRKKKVESVIDDEIEIEDENENESEIEKEEINGEKIFVTITSQEEFKAGDLDSFLSNFEVINKDHVIATLEPFVKLQIEIDIEKGRGYVQAEENEKKNKHI